MFKVYHIGPKTWSIGVADMNIPMPRKGMVYHDEDDAVEMAEFLNHVYEAGQSSVRKSITQALGL